MQQVVENIELSRLPSLPEILLRILQEFGSENLQVRELAGLVMRDPALSLKILAVANSAAYSHQKTISSIEQCINLLGLKMVKTISVSAATQQFLNTLAGIVPVNFARFWQHSQTTALLAEKLAETLAYPHPDEAYVAGLLHDMGKLALLVARPAAYTPLFADGDVLPEEETSALGINHCEIGAMLVAHWRLEPLIVDAIRSHHVPFPRIAGATELVKILALANALSKVAASASNHPALALARALFDIEAEVALALCAYAHDQVQALAIPLGIAIDDAYAGPTEQPRSKRENHGKNHAEDGAVGVQKQLAEEVHGAMTLDLARDSFSAAGNEEELLSGILKSATILFEPRQAFLFEWDAESNLVSGRPLSENQDAIGRIRFSLSADRSLIAEALLSNRVTRSHAAIEYDDKFVVRGNSETVLSMIDEQIIRMAHAECLYCAPMATRNALYGVLVLAFPLVTIERIDSRTRFLAQFARQAGAANESARGALALRYRSGDHDVAACQAHARRIEHEAGNPLSIMKNYLKLLDIKQREGQPAELEIKIVNEEIDRVARILQQLVATPTEQEPSLAEVDINATIRDIVLLCQPSLFSPLAIKLEIRLDEQLPAIRSDANRLKQVLLNLFKNAAEAMPGGGVLTVVTAATINRQSGAAVAISVADNGPGIAPELLQKLFSPVASSKGSQHAGLGLAIVAELVDALGGSISCRSAATTGTSFDITLPLAAHMSTGIKGENSVR